MKSKWLSLWDSLRALPAARCLKIALFIWVVYGAVVTTIVAIDPRGRSATKEYQMASENWWKGEKSLYRKKNGFLYLPQAAMLYTPYNLLPDRVGEPLWRLTILGLLGWSLWAAAGALAPGQRARVFLVATVLVFPSTLASARNGQVNMPLAALYLLSAVAISQRRWWGTAALLALALALKPISIVPVLLCGVLYAPLRLPLLISLAVMLAAAFAHPNPAYAAGEYREFVACMARAGRPASDTWCDFAGMVRRTGLHLPDAVQLAIRALAAALTLGLCWRAAAIRDAARSAFTVLLLAAIYLMLFNPRTETNSYVILGAFAAVWGAYEGLVSRRLDVAAWLVALAAVLGTENYGWPIFPWTNLWLKALVTLILGAWLAAALLRRPRGESVLMPAAPPGAPV